MTTWTPTLLLLLLAASHLAHAGPLSRSPCELLPVGESHPVQALRRSFAALAGCASRATATLLQEVHVINLRRSDITATAGPDHAPLESVARTPSLLRRPSARRRPRFPRETQSPTLEELVLL
ncbi:unnamed protein product [Gadus morhua 'NCC']